MAPLTAFFSAWAIDARTSLMRIIALSIEVWLLVFSFANGFNNALFIASKYTRHLHIPPFSSPMTTLYSSRSVVSLVILNGTLYFLGTLPRRSFWQFSSCMPRLVPSPNQIAPNYARPNKDNRVSRVNRVRDSSACLPPRLLRLRRTNTSI